MIRTETLISLVKNQLVLPNFGKGFRMGPYDETSLDKYLSQNGPKAFYRKYGFAVFREVIPRRLIERLVIRLKDEVYNYTEPLTRFRGGKVKNEFTREKDLLNGLRNPQAFKIAEISNFVNCYQKIVFHRNVAALLKTLDGEGGHCLRQSLLFTISPATGLHIDSFTVDTWPPGGAHTLWIALEDIDPNSGPPFVVPESHNQNLDFDFRPNSEMLQKPNPIAAANELYTIQLESNRDALMKKRFTPVLKAGDIMAWTSMTVHGSELPTRLDMPRLSMQAIYTGNSKKVGTFLGEAKARDKFHNYYFRAQRHQL